MAPTAEMEKGEGRNVGGVHDLPTWTTNSLLQLLLGSDVGSVTALLLAAVGGPGMKSGVTLAANHLVGVVLLSQQTEGGLDDTTTETQHQVKGRLWKIEQIK